jgi:hypothetical protein
VYLVYGLILKRNKIAAKSIIVEYRKGEVVCENKIGWFGDQKRMQVASRSY